MYLRWIKTITINLLILSIILIFLDPFIPHFSSQKNGETPRLIRLQEHYLNRVSNFKFEENNILFRTNKDGFIIGGNYNDNASENILFLGSSTTECFLVNEDKRFPYYSVELINNKLGTNFNSLNGALGSTNLYHNFLNLLIKTSYPNPTPKYVFLTVGVSDFGYLDQIGNYLDGPRGILISNTPSLFSILKTIKDLFFSNLYMASKKLFEFSIPSNIQGGVDNFVSYSNNNFLVENEEKLYKQWENILDLIISYCKINQINLILLTEHNIDVYKEKTKYSIIRFKNREKINKIIRRKSILNNLKLIDLDLDLEKKIEYYQPDMSHLNDSGSIEVSKIISRNFITIFKNEIN